MAIVSEPSVKANVMPLLLNGMAPRQNWQTKMAANTLFVSLTERYPEAVAMCLPEVVPAIAQIMNDAKPQVKVRAPSSSLLSSNGLYRGADLQLSRTLVDCTACRHPTASASRMPACSLAGSHCHTPLVTSSLRLLTCSPVVPRKRPTSP